MYYITYLNPSEIAFTFRRRREELGLTQAELAIRSGVHLRSVNNIEGGKGNPSLDTLLRLGEVLKLDVLVRRR